MGLSLSLGGWPWIPLQLEVYFNSFNTYTCILRILHVQEVPRMQALTPVTVKGQDSEIVKTQTDIQMLLHIMKWFRPSLLVVHGCIYHVHNFTSGAKE